MSEKIKYQSDWITAQQAAALFDSTEQFVRAIEDGKIQATGRLWSEFDPNEVGARKLIPSSEWEDCKFEVETGHLKGEESDSPWEYEYVSIRIFYPDIEALLNGKKIEKPPAIEVEEEKNLGGRKKIIKSDIFATQIAAYIYSTSKVKIPDKKEDTKEFREALYKSLPCFSEEAEKDGSASMKTLGRYVDEFLKTFHAAIDAMDKNAEEIA